MFKLINAGSRQFRGSPGFPLDADSEEALRYCLDPLHAI
jgi:hypothetical protein